MLRNSLVFVYGVVFVSFRGRVSTREALNDFCLPELLYKDTTGWRDWIPLQRFIAFYNVLTGMLTAIPFCMATPKLLML